MPDIGRREILEKSSKATVGAGLAGLAGCIGGGGDGGDGGGGGGDGGSSEPIKFGAAISKSGQLAANGKAFSDGYNAFVKWINEEKGGLEVDGGTRPVELIEYDDESNCETAVRLVTKLIEEDDVDIILGPYSSGCVFAAVPAAKKNNKLMIQGSGSADKIFDTYNKDKIWVFGTTPPASRYIRGSVAFPAENGAKSVGMFSDQGTFAQSLRAGAKAVAKEKGMDVLVDATVPQDTRDLSSPIQKMASKKPDFVMFNTHLELSVLAQRTAKEQGLSPDLIYGGSGVAEPEYWEALGPDALDTNFYTTWSPEIEVSGNPPYMGNQKAIDVYTGYAENSDSLGGVSSRRISGMQVIQVASWGIEEAGTPDNAAVRDALKSADFSGIFGVQINFDDMGRLKSGGFTGQLLGKEKQPIVFPGDVATGEPQYPRRPWDAEVRQGK